MNANADFDLDLTPVQWETLKALRPSVGERAPVNRFVVQELVALGLVAVADGRAALTAKGREVVLRGSPKLWDVAA
jgi:ribosomal protein S19E (S16A)